MTAGGIGCPPRFEQLLRFLVKQLWIKVLSNQLQHRLSQLLVAAEIEDHIQGICPGRQAPPYGTAARQNSAPEPAQFG